MQWRLLWQKKYWPLLHQCGTEDEGYLPAIQLTKGKVAGRLIIQTNIGLGV